MEPLTPNDPLWKLLGQAKPVQPRPNFAQNVLRQARQTPQERGAWARVRAWFDEGGSSRVAWLGAAAAAVIAVVAALPMLREPEPSVAQTSPAPAAAVAEAVAPEVELPPASDAQWADMEQFDALLAVYDTSDLSDRDIHVLLY